MKRQATLAVLVLAVSCFAMSAARAQTYTVLHTFKGTPDGMDPQPSLMQDPTGSSYGSTIFGGNSNEGSIFKLSKTGKETVLYSFTGSSDGNNPNALVQDAQGNSYGTAMTGGDLTCKAPWGCGTIFKLGASGKLTVLHTFTGKDGAWPFAQLLRDTGGNLWGSTTAGGNLNCNAPDGCGTLFELDYAGKLTVLHTFAGPEGSNPTASLVRDAAGNLYGTTYNGGIQNHSECQIGCGTVFQLTHGSGGWTDKVLYRFTGKSDGGYPVANLILDAKGNLYGTTMNGGDLSCSAGCGTIFKLTHTSRGWKESVLYAFANGPDGTKPFGALVWDKAGNLYGPATTGGDLRCNPPQGCGVLFKLDKTRKLTVLHTFTGRDGEIPYAGLVLNPATNTLYGTTPNGGDLSCPATFGTGCGVVFKLALKKNN